MSDQKSSKPADYVVGYRRPPKAPQFTAGKSGDPKGRPKSSRSVVLQDIIRQKITVKAIPTICATDLSDELVRAFVLADNKLLERAGWNREILAAELGELPALLASADLDISLTGFEHVEIDVLLAEILRKHRVLCGDAREASDYARLKSELAAMVFTDPPYNVRIGGHLQGRGRDGGSFGEIAAERLAMTEAPSTAPTEPAQTPEIEARSGAVNWIALRSPTSPIAPEASK